MAEAPLQNMSPEDEEVEQQRIQAQHQSAAHTRQIQQKRHQAEEKAARRRTMALLRLGCGGASVMGGVFVVLFGILIATAFIPGLQDNASGNTPPTGDITAYKNPFRDVPNFGIGRIDEGVDYTGDGPVYALGAAKISYASSSTGWPGGTYIGYTLSDGPAAGKTIYIAENCTMTQGFQVGNQVDTTTVLCRMHNAYPFIETGWSQAGNDLPMAHDAYGTVADGTPMAFGVNFAQFLRALGTPSPATSSPGAGSLPAGWPTWK